MRVGDPMTTPHVLPPPAEGWRSFWLHPLLVVLWLGSFLLAGALEHAPHASLWFPPAAVTFAGLFCAGWRAAPAIIFSCAVATYLAETANTGEVRLDVLASSSLVFALIHTGAYALPAMMLRRLASAAPAELTLRAVTQFLLLGALGALLAAAFGVLGLRHTGLIEAPDMFELAGAWWIGDYAALVTLAPVLALVLRAVVGSKVVRRFPPFEWGEWRFRNSALGKLACLLGVTAAILFGYLEFSNSRALLVVLVLPVVLQLWIVHTENLATTQLGVLAFSLLTVGAAAAVNVGDDALILQFAAVSLAANTYLSLAAPALLAANQRLRHQVSHDDLTGALSRARFEDRAVLGLASGTARRRPPSIVMLDVNRLKELNDTHGHAAGDAALRALVTRCKQCLRADDFIGRLSGDEFAIYLPDTDEATARDIIRAIRTQLEAAPVQPHGFTVAASFGVATADGSSASLSQLLQVADQAMYAEKRENRRSF
jgi:diguanylate cyclase (GGDEF)-like protein